MHSFGDSFGFRRSAESLISGPESRFRIPLAATWLQGDLVMIDAASAGSLKRAPANTPVEAGYVGLLIQYENMFTPDFITRNPILNTRDASLTIPGLLANIFTGGGVKFWLKNLAAVTTPGHKQYSTETRYGGTPALGDFLGWDGTKYVTVGSAATAVARVTSASSSRIEATLLG